MPHNQRDRLLPLSKMVTRCFQAANRRISCCRGALNAESLAKSDTASAGRPTAKAAHSFFDAALPDINVGKSPILHIINMLHVYSNQKVNEMYTRDLSTELTTYTSL